MPGDPSPSDYTQQARRDDERTGLMLDAAQHRASIPEPQHRNDDRAGQRSESRGREITECWRPSGREMLEVLKQPGIDPKRNKDDPSRTATLAIAQHRYRSGTGIRRECSI